MKIGELRLCSGCTHPEHPVANIDVEADRYFQHLRTSIFYLIAICSTCEHPCPIRLLFTPLANSVTQSDRYLPHLRTSMFNLIVFAALANIDAQSNRYSQHLRTSMFNRIAICSTCEHRCSIRSLFAALANRDAQSDRYLQHLRTAMFSSIAYPIKTVATQVQKITLCI